MNSRKKLNIFRVAMILICFMCCWLITRLGGSNYDNKGKKALINGKDTCTILSEQHQFKFRIHPREITVLYKDKEGRFVEQSFQEGMIKVIE